MQLLLFVFWGATPIPKYRLFNSAEIQRIGRTLKQKDCSHEQLKMRLSYSLTLEKKRLRYKKSISNAHKNNKSLKMTGQNAQRNEKEKCIKSSIG